MLFAHYASELSTSACMDGTVQSVILPLYWALLKKEYSEVGMLYGCQLSEKCKNLSV